MTQQERIRNLQVPGEKVDVVLDTDAFNEIDDQFALAYLLLSPEKINLLEIYAAPFFNENSTSPEDGMERSYTEIKKVLTLAGREEMIPRTYRGSRNYLPDENTPVPSEAAERMVSLSKGYSIDHPLYIIAISAITNVSSAFLIDPSMKERTVVVWLGGHARWERDTKEFNMWQDVAAARIIFGCGVPFVQIPCRGVADRCISTEPELRHFLGNTNPLAEYLMQNTIDNMARCTSCPTWSKVIWDITAVAWLLDSCNTASELIPSPVPEYDGTYSFDPARHTIRCVSVVYRDRILDDLFRKLIK